jgi:hypothetical protein
MEERNFPMPRTGETCQTSGIYKVINHIKHPKEITMVKGKEFPPCSECHEKVEYQLKEATQH